MNVFCFFFNYTATTEIYTLSLHDALPICPQLDRRQLGGPAERGTPACRDRKSTRLNSSHLGISYAVFCLKKKTYTIYAQDTHGNNIQERYTYASDTSE